MNQYTHTAHTVYPTGRWKIRQVNNGTPSLELECQLFRFSWAGPFTSWYPEDFLEVYHIAEYENECRK